MFFKRRLKIAIVGGCQAEGLRESTQALLPKAEVASWHAGVHPPDAPDILLQKLKAYDLVLSQITPGHGLELLEMDNLRRELKNVHFMPTIAFPGFHPDMTYILTSQGPLSAVHSDFHSRIAVASYLLGLTPERTLTLYNAAVFSALGYFDVFPAARIAMEETLRESGFVIDGLIDGWLGEIGPFMFMSNHPHVRLLTTLCRDMYVKLGLLKPKAPVPFVAKDHLSESFTWPVYPALARRLGIQGSLNFQRPKWLVPPGERDLPLGQYLKDLFAYYAGVERKVLEVGSVIKVRDTLAALLDGR